ncbi:hypothetical protein NCS56_00371600 [Fusarium sp. Ph1]|nr:hypothetical protein NCS56_00371600 [Fusarium sp. Ph1]
MLDKQIKSMRDHADFDETKRILSNKEDELNASEHDIISALGRAKSEAQSYKQQLEDNLAAAEKSYASAVVAAIANLDQARHDAAVVIHLTETDLQRAQSQSEEAIRQAQSDLNQKRNTFKLIFGSARSDLEQTRKSFDEAIIAHDTTTKDLEDLDRRLNEACLLDMPILLAEKAVKAAEQVVAGAALEAARVVLEAAELVIQWSEFIAVEAVIAASEMALDNLVKSEAALMKTARAAFDELKCHQEDIMQRAAQALEYAEKSSPEPETSTQAKALLADSKTCAEYLAVATAEKALAATQSNTVEIELARQACELAEQDSSSFADDILDVGLNIGKWIASAAAELINITNIEFLGSISSLVADGPPLIVNVQGKLLGQDIDLHINWQPHFNLAKFIKAIFSDLWEMIKNAAGKFLDEIGAKIVGLAENIAEAVEEPAEEIGEGVEKAAEAIGEGAEKVAEAIDDAVSDVASALDDAGSAIGHTADDAVNDVGSALNDAGSAVGHAADDVASVVEHAASDVGHAVEDVASDIGNAFNDAGNAVENVASDVGNATSGLFSW